MVESADMVWFFMPGISSHPLSWSIKRPTGALWAYYELESPGYEFNRHEREMRMLNSEINMMSTYQLASDIYPRTYGAIVPREAHETRPALPDFRAKTGLMVAVIYNSDSKLRNRRLAVSRCMWRLVMIHVFILMLGA
jgi:hypothetical protein